MQIFLGFRVINKIYHAKNKRTSIVIYAKSDLEKSGHECEKKTYKNIR